MHRHSHYSAHSAAFLYWMVVVALAVSAFIAALWWIRLLRNARLSEDTPTSRIRSAAQGYVELMGVSRARGGVALRSPGTHAPCVWWKLEVFVGSETSGDDGRVITRSSRETFHLEDATGRCTIDPEGAELTPSSKRRWLSATVGGPPGHGPYLCIESVLAADARVYVLGEFRSVRRTPQALDLMRSKLAAWQADPARAAVLDVNRDGVLDATELEAGRRAALLEARREAGVDISSEDIVGKPEDGRPFVISAAFVRARTRSQRSTALFSLAWCIASVLALLWILSLRLVF